MTDRFSNHATGLTSPAQDASGIVPSNSKDLPAATRAIYVGGGGDLQVTMLSGETVTLEGVSAGMIYPLRVVRVRASGTTATGLVGLR